MRPLLRPPTGTSSSANGYWAANACGVVTRSVYGRPVPAPALRARSSGAIEGREERQERSVEGLRGLQVGQVPGAVDLHQAGIAVMVAHLGRDRGRDQACRARRSRPAWGRRSLRGRAWSRAARPCRARRPRSRPRAAPAIAPRTCSHSSAGAWSLRSGGGCSTRNPFPSASQAVGQRASALRGLRRVGTRSRVREDQPGDPLARHPPELERHVAAHRQPARHDRSIPAASSGLQAAVGGGAHRHRRARRRRCRRTRAATAPPPAIRRPRGSSPVAPTCWRPAGTRGSSSTPSADSVIGSLSR